MLGRGGASIILELLDSFVQGVYFGGLRTKEFEDVIKSSLMFRASGSGLLFKRGSLASLSVLLGRHDLF